MARAIIIGAGILGSMHAAQLVAAGHDVVHLECDKAPTSASVRNFGLIWVSGRRSGAELATARRARELWAELAAEIPGFGFRPAGSFTVALEATERKIMEEFAATPAAAERGTAFLEPEDVRRLNPAVKGDICGGLFCSEDATVEPREVLGALRTHLSASTGYQFMPERRVVEIDTRTAIDHLGDRWSGDLILVTTGALHNGLLGEHLSAAPIRRVRLQMLETAPYGEEVTTSLADADSMRYYPAYAETSLSSLPLQSELAAAEHLQLLLVQRLHGGLTIGDSHLYEEPFDFDLSEVTYDELLSRAERVLGSSVPKVLRRWEGVYSQCTDDRLYYRAEVEPGVWVVTGPGGRGMTCAPAIAEETLQLVGLQ